MKLYTFEDTQLPDNLSQTMARMITINEKKMPYQKIAKGQYKLYCPYCQNYKLISYEELKQIRSNKTRQNEYCPEMVECPICKTKFNATTNKLNHKIYDNYVWLDIDGQDLGYHIKSEWNFGEPIKLISAEQFAIFNKDETYVKCGYALACFGRSVVYNPDYESGYYRKAVSHGYSWACYDYYSNWLWEYGSRVDKKKYIEDIFHLTKSNQQTIVYKTKCDSDYVNAIKLFGINSVDEFEKYKPYLKKNLYHLRDWKTETLNVHYLDYLNRNNIDLGKFYQYSQYMKKLGFKLDKPTDFPFRYTKIEDMVTAEQDKAINEKIMSRYDELPKYTDDKVLIYPFHKAQEIRNCGKSLHNCIGGYVEKYANKKTDIYRVDLDGRLTAALEILNGKLYQARADHNSKCTDEIMNHVKSFCKKNGFSLGTYA